MVPRMSRDIPHAPPKTYGKLQTESPLSPYRAFVVQFEPIEGPRSRLRGRAELVSSGEAIRFRSLTQLVDFLVGHLRRGHPHPDASPAPSGPTRNTKRRQ